MDSSFTGRDRLFHRLRSRWAIISNCSIFTFQLPSSKVPSYQITKVLSQFKIHIWLLKGRDQLFHRLRSCRASYQIVQSAQVSSQGAAQVVLQSVKHSHACTTTNTQLFGFIQGFILDLSPPQNQLWLAAFDLFWFFCAFVKETYIFQGRGFNCQSVWDIWSMSKPCSQWKALRQ